MDTLELDLTLPRRDFTVELTLGVGRETFALVGPSGSGKTSVLRAIAGLERPGSGRIALGGLPLFDAAANVDVRAEDRRVGFVFQEYALFPHMTVAQNVAFAGAADVPRLLERFRIGHLAGARPATLSGGERQRVALARALARDPAALLLDEPMAALDAHTRAGVRHELLQMIGDLDIPVIVVTHDFHDAAVLAGRIGVMSHGRLSQVGTVTDLLAAPANAFVASFTGANVLQGVARPGRDGLTAVTLGDGNVIHSVDGADGPVELVVHPWELSIGRERRDGSAMNQVTGPVASLVPLGNRVRIQVGPLVAEITAASADAMDLRVGEPVTASFKAAATRLMERGVHYEGDPSRENPAPNGPRPPVGRGPGGYRPGV